MNNQPNIEEIIQDAERRLTELNDQVQGPGSYYHNPCMIADDQKPHCCIIPAYSSQVCERCGKSATRNNLQLQMYLCESCARGHEQLLIHNGLSIFVDLTLLAPDVWNRSRILLRKAWTVNKHTPRDKLPEILVCRDRAYISSFDSPDEFNVNEHECVLYGEEALVAHKEPCEFCSKQSEARTAHGKQFSACYSCMKIYIDRMKEGNFQVYETYSTGLLFA